MSITVKEPFNLRATLAKMKKADSDDGIMYVWDADIEAVEDAIKTIEAIRNLKPLNRRTNYSKDLIIKRLKDFKSLGCQIFPTELPQDFKSLTHRSEGI